MATVGFKGLNRIVVVLYLH